jgi:hypothetical protein
MRGIVPRALALDHGRVAVLSVALGDDAPPRVPIRRAARKNPPRVVACPPYRATSEGLVARDDPGKHAMDGVMPRGHGVTGLTTEPPSADIPTNPRVLLLLPTIRHRDRTNLSWALELAARRHCPSVLERWRAYIQHDESLRRIELELVRDRKCLLGGRNPLELSRRWIRSLRSSSSKCLGSQARAPALNTCPLVARVGRTLVRRAARLSHARPTKRPKSRYGSDGTWVALGPPIIHCWRISCGSFVLRTRSFACFPLPMPRVALTRLMSGREALRPVRTAVRACW